MNSQDTERLKTALERAARVYDKSVDKQVVVDWFDLLRDLPISRVEDAITQHCAYGRYFPRPAEIRKRATGQERDTPEDKRESRCKARGCPNPIASSPPGLCRFHSPAPESEWDRITDGICRHLPEFDYEPDFKQRAQLEFLAESGRYGEMAAVCGQRGLRWARQRARDGHIKPGSYRPSPQASRAAAEWLAQAGEPA